MTIVRGASVAAGLAIAGLLAMPLGGCVRHSSQDTYEEGDVGKAVSVTYGTVLAVRDIQISGKATAAGAAAGGVAGAAAGTAYPGSGTGNTIATIGGAVAGAILGSALEQSIRDRPGKEYTIALETGTTMTVAQEVGEGDVPIAVGERVIVQARDGYQRVLPATNLPTTIQKPQGLKMTNPTP
jgi:outer membrane lipoprotein SlyB